MKFTPNKRTVLNLGNIDIYRLIDIYIGDETLSESDINEMYALIQSNTTVSEVARLFDRKLHKRYIIESSDPDILHAVTFEGEVLDKVIESE